jgi:hypothetical protein
VGAGRPAADMQPPVVPPGDAERVHAPASRCGHLATSAGAAAAWRGARGCPAAVPGGAQLPRECDWCEGTALSSCTLAQLDSALLRAAASGDAGKIALLVRDGALVNAAPVSPAGRLIFPLDCVGWAPMHYAAAAGHSDCIYLLWQLGADAARATPGHRWTPLHLAAAFGHVEAAEMLLDIGCQVDARTEGECSVAGGGGGGGWGGFTALHVAAAAEHEHVVEALHRLHANITLTDYAGRTALTLAQLSNTLREGLPGGRGGVGAEGAGGEGWVGEGGCAEGIGGGGRGRERNGGGIRKSETVKLLIRIEEYYERFVLGNNCRLLTTAEVAVPADESVGVGRDVVEGILPPLSQEEEHTEECGYSTGGHSYSGYASTFGTHKLGDWQKFSEV